MGSPLGNRHGPWPWRRRRRRKRDRCDACDGCDVCGFSLLSLTLLVAAVLVPDAGGTPLVSGAIAGYRRWLTRFTAACPSTPSCSAYAASAVREHGARHGLRLAAARLRGCG